MKKLNQNGLGALILLLILLLLLVLGGVGWWVWKQQNEKKSAGDTAQSQPAENKEEKAAEKPKETPKKYLEIKELGVKLELDDATADAYYVMKNGYAYISLTSLKNLNAECGADKTGVVAIGAYTKTDTDEMVGKTYEQIVTEGQSGAVIGNKAYIMNRSQAYCSDDVSVQAKQQAAWNSFLSKAKTIQAL